jgi:glycosyltransferase involved in cell wall biosynthesis
MKLVFVGPLVSRFVKNDLAELSKVHTVYPFDGNIGRGWKALINLAILNIRLCLALLKADAILYWFADYYSGVPTYVAKLLRKKIYIIAGGFDIWYLPELGVGAKTRPFRWWAVRTGFKYADLAFPVSNYAKEMMDRNVPEHGEAVVIYSAVEDRLFHYEGETKKSVALTVTQVDALNEYVRKGIDVFINVAKITPEVEFRIVGIRGDAEQQALKDASGVPNVVIVPAPVPSEALRLEYCTASVYCQLSVDETFGLAIAEAMNCGCMPVVSEVEVFREVTGDLGYMVPTSDLSAVSRAIVAGMNLTGDQIQSYISRASNFHLSVRAKRLLQYIQ